MTLALITDGNSRIADTLLSRLPLACLIDFSPQSVHRFRSWTYLRLRWRCYRQGTHYYHASRHNKPQVATWLRQHRITLGISYYAPLLPQSVVSAPSQGIINLHPSRLPRYRGADPLFWQALKGENPIGSTVHFLDSGIDSGAIVAQSTQEVTYPLSRTELEQQLIEQQGIQLIVQAVEQLSAETPTMTPSAQPQQSPTAYAKRIRQGQWHDGLDWATLSDDELQRLAVYLGQWPAELLRPTHAWQAYCPWVTRREWGELLVQPDGLKNWQLIKDAPTGHTGWWLQTPAGQVAVKPAPSIKSLLKSLLNVLLRR